MSDQTPQPDPLPAPPPWAQPPPPGAAPPTGMGSPSLGTSIYGTPAGWVPGGPTQQVVGYAGFGSRLGALLIDGLAGLATLIPAIIAAGILIATGPKQTYTSTDEFGNITRTRGPAIGYILLGVALVVFVAIAFQIWNQVLRVGRTGQSIGKKALGIKVVGFSTGQPIGVGRALGRAAFAAFISGNFCYLGYLWMLWDSQKQTWHDKVVESIVITAR